MLFASFLGVIEAVARLGEKASAGAVQKMNHHLTIGQVKRALTQLEREGYMSHTVVPYGRTGRKVYYLSGLCSTNIAILDQAINEAEYLNGSEAAS